MSLGYLWDICHICGISARYVLQVIFFESMFFHRPGSKKTCWLRASKQFRGRERRHDVLVDCLGAQQEPYVAQLMMFLSVLFENKVHKLCVHADESRNMHQCVQVHKLAFIRWYEKFGRPTLSTGGCRVVKPELMKNILTRHGHPVP